MFYMNLHIPGNKVSVIHPTGNMIPILITVFIVQASHIMAVY